MIQTAELVLWAAAALAGLSLTACVAAAWTGRSDLARLGGRAAAATAALLFLSLVGLVLALVTVRLEYAYVAAYSGLGQPVGWRIAAAWTGPSGAALFLTFLIVTAAAVSHRLDNSRQSAARTAALLFLGGVGLILVLSVARPFTRLGAPSGLGMGLPLASLDPLWQVQVVSVFLAAALSSMAFAGVVGEQLVESPAWLRTERQAVALTTLCLTVGLIAASWRAHDAYGELLMAPGLAGVLPLLPAWLVGLGHLHAPAGPSRPVWAARWSRVLAVILFPTALGLAAATVGGAGETPIVPLWTGGLVLGLVTGALAGLSRTVGAAAWPESVTAPGYGGWALLGGAMALALAGLVAVATLLGQGWGPEVPLLVALLPIAGAAVWMLARPVRGRRLWPAALGIALVAGVAAWLVSSGPWIGAATGLLLAALVGSAGEVARRLGAGVPPGDTREFGRAAWRARSTRRVGSALAHLGLACLGLGLWASALTRTEMMRLTPGTAIALGGGPDSVVYLGLSRYRVQGADRAVATFRGQEGGLMMARLTYDWATGYERREPAMDRGLFRDVTVDIAARGDDEAIECRIVVRPLANLLWVGGALLALGLAGSGRSPALPPAPADRSRESDVDHEQAGAI